MRMYVSANTGKIKNSLIQSKIISYLNLTLVGGLAVTCNLYILYLKVVKSSLKGNGVKIKN